MADIRTWEAWQSEHQPFELAWWKEHVKLPSHSLSDPGFRQRWDVVNDWIEPHGKIIDIGCGPRPPWRPSTVIEPLALEYMKFTPWQWWNEVTYFAQPAETRFPDLKADTIICWNALDHLIDWRDVLDNMLAYGRKNARFAIATDFWPPFVGHPGFEKATFMREIEKRFTIHKQREPFGRHMALLMTAKANAVA